MTIRDIGFLCFAVVTPLATNNVSKVLATLLGALLLAWPWPNREDWKNARMVEKMLAYRMKVGPVVTPRSRWAWRMTVLDWPLVIVAVGILFATALSRFPAWSFFPTLGRGDGALTWLAYLLACAAIARGTKEEGTRWVRWIVAGACIEGAVVALQIAGIDLAKWAGNGGIPPSPPRFTGTLGNPDFLGAYAALVFPVALGINLWASAPVLICLVGSLSRGGMLGAAAGAWVLTILENAKVAIGVVVTLAVGMALFFSVVLAFDPHVGGEHARTVVEQQFTTSVPGALHQRWILWRLTFGAIVARPWGYGLSELWATFKLGGGVADNPHDEILYVAEAGGLLTLAGYLAVWVLALRRLLRGLAPAPFLAAGLIGYGIVLIFLWNHIGVANVCWAFLGMSVPLGRDRGGQA